MNKKRLLLFVTSLSMLIYCPALADFDYADSSEFSLDLLTLPLGGAYDYSDSSQFGLDLYPVNRAWGDADLSYDWLANCDPPEGPAQTPVDLPTGNLLKQLDENGNWVDPFEPLPGMDDIVFIINHGWNDGPEEGIKTLAKALAERVFELHGPDHNAYFYTWAWGKGPDQRSFANPNGKGPTEDFAFLEECKRAIVPCFLGAAQLVTDLELTHANAVIQGWLLGMNLHDMGIHAGLQRIHMVGHSYGGVVCAEAAKLLYVLSGFQEIDQLTTLDTPATPAGYALGSIDPKKFERVEVIYYSAVQNLLKRGGTGGPRIGNYDNLLNLALSNAYYPTCTLSNNCYLHSKSIDWYINSMNAAALDCDGRTYGFGWSLVNDPENPLWHEELPKGWQMEVSPGGMGCMIPIQEVVEEILSAVSEVAKEKFESATDWVGNKAEIVIDSTTNFVNSAIQLTLTPAVLPLNKAQVSAYQEASEPNALDNAYIYTQLDIPQEARLLMFDYRFEGVSPGDVLTLSIEDKILIILDAEVEGVTQEYQHTLPVNITEFAGQNVLLQIALRPTGGGASSVLIDNLTFITRTIPGDIDGDLFVGLSDIVIIADHWLDLGLHPAGDIAPTDGDGTVNISDLAALAENWQIDISGGP